MDNIDTKETFGMIWNMYRRQKDAEAEVGVEVADDMNRMRAWMQSCVKGASTDDKLEETFGPDPVDNTAGKCVRCGGEGWYFSREARMQRRSRTGGYEDVRVPGMVVCMCFYGQELNQQIAKIGRKKSAPTKKRPV